jgi:hypothetical protein
MNIHIGIQSYSYAVAIHICSKSMDTPAKPRWQWYHTKKRKRIREYVRKHIHPYFSCISSQTNVVPYFMSPETANNSTQSIHNILTEREIEQIMDNCSNFNTDYLPATLIIRSQITNTTESTAF